MRIASFGAVVSAVLLATAGAAQSGEVLTATGSHGTGGFSALTGITAVPMSIEESAAVQGRYSVNNLFNDLVLFYPPDPIYPPDPVRNFLMTVEIADKLPTGR